MPARTRSHVGHLRAWRLTSSLRCFSAICKLCSLVSSQPNIQSCRFVMNISVFALITKSVGSNCCTRTSGFFILPSKEQRSLLQNPKFRRSSFTKNNHFCQPLLTEMIISAGGVGRNGQNCSSSLSFRSSSGNFKIRPDGETGVSPNPFPFESLSIHQRKNNRQ